MNLNVEDMLTLFFALLAITCFITYIRRNFTSTTNKFERAVLLIVVTFTLILMTNSFGRILEVLGYGEAGWLLSKIRRIIYIIALVFSSQAGIVLCTIKKHHKEQ
ncbi:hypothetical protein [Paenibacillus nuruki]|uniref:hypothetical protein n=1 Tax=Paenibacillus nuruki TaxID=1886670 RepID=UPI0028046CDF|nr:hypothetical protein [Paenibacillus nuruki]CAJ1315893.1 hypothetical protein AASFL403_11770 [Paenibacillus nuruki]